MFTKAALTATAIGLGYMVAAGAAGTTDAAASAHPTAGARRAQAGMQRGVIHDPTLNLDAFYVYYPAKWHFQGALLGGSACSAVPVEVFRTFSPDGLTEIEQLPTFNWVWSNSPYAPKALDGCLPLKQALSAQDFLKYLSAILKVEYVGEQPWPAEKLAKLKQNYNDQNAMWAAKYRALGMTPPTNSGDWASAIVRYRNGSFAMSGRLNATVQCLNSVVPGIGRTYESHGCFANVRYVHAPDAQFKAVEAATDNTVKDTVNGQWLTTYMAQQDQQSQQRLSALRQQTAQQMAARQQSFEQGQAMRQRQHEEFLSTMQRGTDMSMQQAARVANTSHTMASDWTDYALDQQTVRDPGTGQVSKVSSASSYTWLDASGKTAYQTSDPNANPNGTLQGTWTLQRQVHGDGTP